MESLQARIIFSKKILSLKERKEEEKRNINEDIDNGLSGVRLITGAASARIILAGIIATGTTINIKPCMNLSKN